MLAVIKYSVAIGMSASVLLFPAKAQEEILQNQVKVLGTSETKQESLIRPTPEFLNVAAIPQLTAKASLAFDLNSGSILYTYNFDEKLPIASLTKLMTAIVVIENLDLNKAVVIQKSDTQIIGSNMGLLTGEQILVGDLLRAMLIPSSNDAAKALARVTAGSEERFVQLMNAKAAALGLESTHFTTPVGLDDLESNDNYSTAYDLGKIVEAFIANPILSEMVTAKETIVYSTNGKIPHKLRTTNKLLLENEKVTGIKTGFTDLAKGNLIIRQTIGDSEVISIVLGSDNREEDSRRLINWIETVYLW